jgi:hypothetical protein
MVGASVNASVSHSRESEARVARTMHRGLGMKRIHALLGMIVGLACVAGFESEASACGGCVVPPNQTASDITDERMLLAVSPQQTTLYDQIRYAGNPESFAWVLPIQGTVDVGLSADVLFASIDGLTQTTINPPVVACPGPPAECLNDARFSAAGSAGEASPNGGVDVLKQENVGPYATVQIRSTDPNALTTWLVENGFQIKPEEKPIIEQYVKEGYDFLALKLKPNEGVNSMRPVRVSTQGASLSLPLRMAAVGTGAKVGITIWVVAEGRYEPKNFPFFRIEDNELTWDFAQGSSNYSDLRTQKEAQFGGRGWELQSSLTLAQQIIRTRIESGGSAFGQFGGATPAPAVNDYLAIEPDGQNPGKTAEQVREEDIADLFAGMKGASVRVTRIRSDVAKTAMNVDFYLQASADQSEISNIRNVTKYTNLQCPVYNNCSVDGFAPTPEEAAARTAANSNSSESFACKTSPSHTSRDVGLASALGGLGLVVAFRRRRRSTS